MAETKHQYLKAMGIDVWVPRAKAAEPGRLEEAEHERGGGSRPAKEAAPGEGPAFDLCFVVYEGLGMVFEQPADRQTGGSQRLCDDVARAFLARPARGTVSHLKWPMVEAAHVRQDESAARDAVRRKIESLPEKVIAFGPLARDYLDGRDEAVVQRKGKAVLAATELSRLMDDPSGKRMLWKNLLTLRAVS